MKLKPNGADDWADLSQKQIRVLVLSHKLLDETLSANDMQKLLRKKNCHKRFKTSTIRSWIKPKKVKQFFDGGGVDRLPGSGRKPLFPKGSVAYNTIKSKLKKKGAKLKSVVNELKGTPLECSKNTLINNFKKHKTTVKNADGYYAYKTPRQTPLTEVHRFEN